MTRHNSSPHRRDAARRLAELLHEVRQAKPDARDFALFERRAALAALGVPHAMIDGFDAQDDAALDGHIAEAWAAARETEHQDEPLFVRGGDEDVHLSAPKAMFGLDLGALARDAGDAMTAWGSRVGQQAQQFTDAASKGAEEMLTRATTVDRRPPTSIAALPKTLSFEGINDKLRNVRDWTDQTGIENGGAIVQRPWGGYGLIHNIHSGDKSGAAADDLKNSYAVGFTHAHPRGDKMDPVTRQRLAGGSLSGGDMASLINAGGNIMMAQDGDHQYAFVRTDKTPVFKADRKALDKLYDAVVGQYQAAGKSFGDATDLAAREMAGRFGLGYYSGQNGKLSRQAVPYDPQYLAPPPKRP